MILDFRCRCTATGDDEHRADYSKQSPFPMCFCSCHSHSLFIPRIFGLHSNERGIGIEFVIAGYCVCFVIRHPLAIDFQFGTICIQSWE